MKANEIQISRFLAQTETKFIIPVYQRNYDWKQKQCEQLLNDIHNINDNSGYFIGSVVHKSVSNLTGIRELVIIDGQQRITTLTILLYVISEIFRDNQDPQYEKIVEQYVINKYDNSDIKLKLKPVESDFETLIKLVNNNTSQIPVGNRLLENYLYFKESISSYELAKQLYNNFNQLIVVEIALDEKDNPQRIFQSLNSTGLELSQADLIRNYILMDLDYSSQESVFRDYWSIIEANCKDEKTYESRLSYFFRDFLTFKFNKIPSYNKVFEEFKIRYTINSTSLEYLYSTLEEMKQFSSYYYKFINFESVLDIDIKSDLRNINMLEVSVSYPFLLGVFDDYNKSTIDKKELLDILKLIQSFVFRRFICNLPTNALNKIFMTLWVNAWKVKTKYPAISLYQATAKVLNDYGSYQQFPRDEEVRENLKIRDIYKAQSKNKQYLFEMLENNYSKFIENTIDITTNKNISIEHIFPQNPNLDWEKDIESKEELESMKTLLNTLGNLTIVINNSSLGNKSFIEKRDLNTDTSKGYRYSKYKLNETLIDLDKWNLQELQNRSSVLIDKFISIWSYPQIEFDLEEIEPETDFLDIKDPTFTKPEYIMLNGVKTPVTSHRQVVVEVLKNIHNTEPEVLFIPIIKNLFSITRDPDSLRSPLELDDAIYIESNYSAKDLYSKLTTCIENCGYNIDLKIKLNPVNHEQE
ncbi:MAG: DUF262 domain-containing protein [Patescibacteria group bacterium]